MNLTTAVTGLSMLAFISGLTGCADSDSDNPQVIDTTVNFAARIEDDDFACSTTYSNFGAGSTVASREFQINDVRLYISNPVLVTSGNQTVVIDLQDDGVWQYQNMALLDFEDGCTGTPETNTQITGQVTLPEGEAVSSLCFDVGIPFEFNHLNNTDSPSPLNASGMFWKWQSGHKFIRIDGKGDPNGANVSYNLHLGSTGCVSNAAIESPTVQCAEPNLPRVCVDITDTSSQQVVLDLKALFANTDITKITPNTSSGCMSANNDPECQTLFPEMGLEFRYSDGVNAEQVYPAQTQSMFRVHSL